MGIITVPQIRAYLDQLEVPNEAEDALLLEIAGRAESIVEGYLGHTYAAYGVATDKSLRAQGTSVLWLPEHLRGSITAVKLAGQSELLTGWVEGGKGDLYLYSAQDPSFSLSWGNYRYTVTAQWGYGPAPKAVEEVCLELAVNIWRGKDRGMWTDVIGVEGSGGIRFTGGMNNYQKGILDGFKAGRRSPGATSSRVSRS